MGVSNIPQIDELVQTEQVPATLGQKVKAGSLSVTVASDQIVPTTSSTTPLTPASPATFAVTTISATAVVANASRKGLVITNITKEPVFLAFGVPAELNKGIYLSGFGTWYMDEFSFVTTAINVISSGASTLSIQEFS